MLQVLHIEHAHLPVLTCACDVLVLLVELARIHLRVGRSQAPLRVHLNLSFRVVLDRLVLADWQLLLHAMLLLGWLILAFLLKSFLLHFYSFQLYIYAPVTLVTQQHLRRYLFYAQFFPRKRIGNSPGSLSIHSLFEFRFFKLEMLVHLSILLELLLL